MLSCSWARRSGFSAFGGRLCIPFMRAHITNQDQLCYPLHVCTYQLVQIRILPLPWNFAALLQSFGDDITLAVPRLNGLKRGSPNVTHTPQPHRATHSDTRTHSCTHTCCPSSPTLALDRNDLPPDNKAGVDSDPCKRRSAPFVDDGGSCTSATAGPRTDRSILWAFSGMGWRQSCVLVAWGKRGRHALELAVAGPYLRTMHRVLELLFPLPSC